MLPAHKLHPSTKLSFEQLALVETLTSGAHAVSRAQIESGEWDLVIGAEPVSLGAMIVVGASAGGVAALLISRQRRRAMYES